MGKTAPVCLNRLSRGLRPGHDFEGVSQELGRSGIFFVKEMEVKVGTGQRYVSDKPNKQGRNRTVSGSLNSS